MQCCCMNIKSNAINTLNPGQIPVHTAKQPIFTLTKELAIHFPDKFRLNKYFCLFASLRIEASMLIICGQVIKRSVLEKIMCTYGLSNVGAEFLVTVNNLKRASHSLQVGACVIYSKLKQANMDTGSDVFILSWLVNKIKINEMDFYWKVIVKLMIDLLVFIRSLIWHPYVNSYAGTLL